MAVKVLYNNGDAGGGVEIVKQANAWAVDPEGILNLYQEGQQEPVATFAKGAWIAAKVGGAS